MFAYLHPRRPGARLDRIKNYPASPISRTVLATSAMNGAGGHTKTSHSRASAPSRAAAPTSAAKVFAASRVVGLSFQFPAMTARRVAEPRALAPALPGNDATCAMLRSSDATASSRATTPSPFVAEVAAAAFSFDFSRQWSRSPARVSARRRPLPRAGEGAKSARVARAVDASMTSGAMVRARACAGGRWVGAIVSTFSGRKENAQRERCARAFRVYTRVVHTDAMSITPR